MPTPSPSSSSRHSRSSTPQIHNPRLRSSPRHSPITTPTSNTTKQKIKTSTILKSLFLSILILLVYFLLRINLQLIQRLSEATSKPHHETNVAATTTIRTSANDNTKKLRAVKGLQSSSSINEEEQELLQNRLVTLRTEVTTMQKKVDDMKSRMGHVKSIQRSSSASAILGTAGGVGTGGGGGSDARAVGVHSSTKTTNNKKNEFNRHTCTPNQQTLQSTRLQKRFVEWWSHSACPDQIWMDHIDTLFHDATTTTSSQQPQQQPYLILDIGCNKGYTSADFLDALSPGTNMNPHTLVKAIRSIAKEDNTKYDRDGGVCNDSKKALNEDRVTVRDVEVHCFEPSPVTFDMLVRAKKKLMPQDDNGGGGGAKWFIHNKGMHNKNGEMAWHSACAHAVGDELCTIVDEGTPDAITVPVVTVDTFLEETYPAASKSSEVPPLVHMLKIDAEGLDPAVLQGAWNVLTENRAIMVMFEYNPGLSEKGDHPHGMWGKKGNPHVTLFQVTDWLDSLGYDCYLDTHLPDENEKKKKKKKGGMEEAPGLYRITGECMTKEPNVRGWANVVCASRRYGNVAERLLQLATVVH